MLCPHLPTIGTLWNLEFVQNFSKQIGQLKSSSKASRNSEAIVALICASVGGGDGDEEGIVDEIMRCLKAFMGMFCAC